MAKSNPPGNWLPIQDDIASYFKTVDRFARIQPDKSVRSILAVDPGITNLAVAFLYTDDDLPLSANGDNLLVRTTKFAMPKFETTYAQIMYIDFMIDYWTQGCLQGFGCIDLMVKESVAHGYAGGVADAGRVQHMLEHYASRRKIPWMDVTPMSMRAYFKSKAKSDTKLAVYKRFGLEFPSEDECDVFAIGMTGLAMHLGEYQTAKKKKAAK